MPGPNDNPNTDPVNDPLKDLLKTEGMSDLLAQLARQVSEGKGAFAHALPDKMVWRGGVLLPADPAAQPEPSKPRSAVLEEIATLYREVFVEGKSQRLPLLLRCSLGVCQLSLNQPEDVGLGLSHVGNSAALEPGALSLALAYEQDPRARAVLPPNLSQNVMNTLAALRYFQELRDTADGFAEFMDRVLAVQQHKALDLVRDGVSRVGSLITHSPGLDTTLAPAQHVITAAAEKAQDTKRSNKAAHAEGRRIGIAEGRAAARAEEAARQTQATGANITVSASGPPAAAPVIVNPAPAAEPRKK